MTHNFCTLFDRNYLYKGLVLYNSLCKNSNNFQLWILCMDDITFQLLSAMKLQNVKLITSHEFENENLLKLKRERTVAEYSWTCTANLCRYILDIGGVEMITYLDADMKFYSDPEIIFNEIGQSSIAIIEHRFSPERAYLAKTGKYNVSWVSFRNNDEGRKAASWWADKVNDWCYNRYEEGKFGDQMYLDDWMTRFDNIIVIKTKGAGIAPWNMNNYQISEREGQLFIDNEPLVFYHFHGFYLLGVDSFLAVGHYYLSRNIIEKIYQPYFRDMQMAIDVVKKYSPDFNYGFKNLAGIDKVFRLLFKSKIFETLFLFFARLKS